MTPTQIEEAARNRYNSIGDDFYSQDEILKLMYFAQVELVQEGLIIEATYQTTSVADQQEYSFPTDMVAIKRVEYDGAKLKPINFRQDDSITLNDARTTNTGEPAYYTEWNNTIILRPIPDDAKTITIRGYKEPSIPTISSSLEVPSFFHGAIVDYVVKEMAFKDQNIPIFDRYERKFETYWKPAIRKWVAKRKRTDAFQVVNNEDSLGNSLLGAI